MATGTAKRGCTGPQQEAQKLLKISLCCFLGHYLVNIRLLVPVPLHLVNLLTALLLLMLACDPIIKLLTWQQREMA